MKNYLLLYQRIQDMDQPHQIKNEILIQLIDRFLWYPFIKDVGDNKIVVFGAAWTGFEFTDGEFKGLLFE